MVLFLQGAEFTFDGLTRQRAVRGHRFRMIPGLPIGSALKRRTREGASCVHRLQTGTMVGLRRRFDHGRSFLKDFTNDVVGADSLGLAFEVQQDAVTHRG